MSSSPRALAIEKNMKTEPSKRHSPCVMSEIALNVMIPVTFLLILYVAAAEMYNCKVQIGQTSCTTEPALLEKLRATVSIGCRGWFWTG